MARIRVRRPRPPGPEPDVHMDTVTVPIWISLSRRPAVHTVCQTVQTTVYRRDEKAETMAETGNSSRIPDSVSCACDARPRGAAFGLEAFGKGAYGPLNPFLFSPQKKACARHFPTSSFCQPVRVAEALRIGPGAKARVVHLWATCRWHLVRRASSRPARRRARSPSF